MRPRLGFGALVLVFCAAGFAAADVSVPFRDYLTQRAAPEVIHEPPWRDVKADPETYRGRTIGYLLKINGRIDSESETHLISTNQAHQSVEVLCPGGCRAGSPGQWVGVLGKLPENGRMDLLVALAVTQVAAPTPHQAAPPPEASSGANGAGMISSRPGETIVEEQPASDPGAAPAAPAGNVAPLAPDSLLQQQRRSEGVPIGYDSNALYRLERFILSRNPPIDANQRRLIATEILRLSSLYGMRWEFFASMIAAESDFNPNCVSGPGATGLGQIMPFNFANLGISNPYDIRQNLNGAAQYITEQLNRYRTLDPTEQFKLALAAYNAGPGAVKKHGGVPPYLETLKYIQKIARLYIRLCNETTAAQN